MRRNALNQEGAADLPLSRSLGGDPFEQRAIAQASAAPAPGQGRAFTRRPPRRVVPWLADRNKARRSGKQPTKETPHEGAAFVRVIQGLEAEGCDAAALSCTEIPLLVWPEDSPLPTLEARF
jgi:hypothetical protein